MYIYIYIYIYIYCACSLGFLDVPAGWPGWPGWLGRQVGCGVGSLFGRGVGSSEARLWVATPSLARSGSKEMSWRRTRAHRYTDMHAETDTEQMHERIHTRATEVQRIVISRGATPPVTQPSLGCPQAERVLTRRLSILNASKAASPLQPPRTLHQFEKRFGPTWGLLKSAALQWALQPSAS